MYLNGVIRQNDQFSQPNTSVGEQAIISIYAGHPLNDSTSYPVEPFNLTLFQIGENSMLRAQDIMIFADVPLYIAGSLENTVEDKNGDVRTINE